MDDLISRQAVYDALDNIKIPRNASWYPYYQQALTAVSKLPSVQPKQGNGSELYAQSAGKVHLFTMIATIAHAAAQRWRRGEK